MNVALLSKIRLISTQALCCRDSRSGNYGGDRLMGMQTLDDRTGHSPGGTERLYHPTWNGMQLKTYELFFRIFHLIFSDQG